MMEGIRNADEWYDLMAREVLGKGMALLAPQRTAGSRCRTRASEACSRNRRALRAGGGCFPRFCGARGGAVSVRAGVCRGRAQAALAARADDARRADRRVGPYKRGRLVASVHGRGAARAEGRAGRAGRRHGRARADALIADAGNPAALDAVPWDKAAMSRDAWAEALAAPGEAGRTFLGALLKLSEAFDGTPRRGIPR